MTKPFHAGRAAENGVVAADFAALGWTATHEILEAPRGFFQAAGGGFDAGGDHGETGQSVDVRIAWRFDQAFSIGLADASGHDGNAALIREHDITADEVERSRWAPTDSADRADSSPPDRRSAGQVQHGVLHGRAACSTAKPD